MSPGSIEVVCWCQRILVGLGESWFVGELVWRLSVLRERKDRRVKNVGDLMAAFLGRRMDEMKKIEHKTDTNQENERAASLVEYVLLVVLIALAAVVVLQLFGQTVSNKFSEINSTLEAT